ncbi:alpha,alpha-trehalase TreA [soil metagenome]
MPVLKKEIYDLHELFEAVQLNDVLEDGKTFVDCIPRFKLYEIEERYLSQRDDPGFNLKKFVADNFEMPPAYASNYESDRNKPVEDNIRSLWDVLTREPGKEESSLINLPDIYIVPGGRFREIYYWDSYFTMLGLKEHGREDLIESMINNFAFLMKNYGHIPNGNRRYYLSRSQPPFFALMISLLAQIKNDKSILVKYLGELLMEHAFWQNGARDIISGEVMNRVACMPDGEILNRYFDSSITPRQESYKEDYNLVKLSNQPAEELFLNLRAGAESGWDFSSRWFADGLNIETIQTTGIIPVDLNCLMYVLEQTIATAEKIAGEEAASKEFENRAIDRKNAILKYCWNEELNFFCDYDFINQQQKQQITAAGLFPLFANIATPEQSALVAENVSNQLLKSGGLVTTTIATGQQWDAPNGWAPLQWVAFKGLNNYGHAALAKDISTRWLSLNEKVFKETGKLMEKYNVEDLDKPAGGGEYPGQDGFGWTNGIYMAMKNSLQMLNLK